MKLLRPVSSLQLSPGLGVVSWPNLTAGNTLTCLVSPKLIYRREIHRVPIRLGLPSNSKQTPIQLPKVEMRPDSPSTVEMWRLVSTLRRSSPAVSEKEQCVLWRSDFQTPLVTQKPVLPEGKHKVRGTSWCSLSGKGQSLPTECKACFNRE